MNDSFQATAEKHFALLEKQIAPIFDKAPHIPQNLKNFLTAVAPWFALIGGILGIFGILSLGVMGTILSFSFMNDGVIGIVMVLTLLVGLASSVLNLLAFAPLRGMKKKGWNFIFYSMVLSLIVSLINISLGYGSGIAMNLLFSLIGFWLLFEVRGMYR